MRYRTSLGALALGLGLSGAASAGTFDGTANLICAVIDAVGCSSGSSCVEGSARELELPQFLFVDFQNKVIRATESSGGQETSPVRNFESTDKQLILQGVENQSGWTAAIDRSSGDLTVTAAGPRLSFILFGACTTY